MKKGNIVFLIFASIWTVILVLPSLFAKNLVLGVRIIMFLTGILPLGLYFTIRAVEHSDEKRANNKQQLQTDLLTRKCKYCKSNIPFKSKTRPVCRRKVTGISTPVAILIVIFFLSFPIIILFAPKKSNTNNINSSLSQNLQQKYQSISTEETKEAEEKTVKFGETIIFNEFEITVDSAEVKESIQISKYTEYTPDEGNAYIAVSATIKNIDTNSAIFLPTYSFENDIRAKLVSGDYEFISSVLLSYSGDLHDTRLNPLSSKSGVIAFSVAKEIADPNNFNLILFNRNESFTFSLNNENQNI